MRLRSRAHIALVVTSFLLGYPTATPAAGWLKSLLGRCCWSRLVENHQREQIPQPPKPLLPGGSGLEIEELEKILNQPRNPPVNPVVDRYQNARDYALHLNLPANEEGARIRAQVLLDLFSKLQLTSHGDWEFKHYRTADGAYAFVGSLPVVLLVRGSDGQLFKTRAPNKMSYRKWVKQWRPDYSGPGMTRYARDQKPQ